MKHLFHIITFNIFKAFTISSVYLKNTFGIRWKKIGHVYLPLDLNLGFNTLRWIINNQYEINEISIIEKTLEPEDIVLEVGTGLGFISTYCSKKNNNKVYTFEANSNNFKICKKVFKKNNVNPHIENKILGLTEGYADFSINNNSILASSLMNNSENSQKVITQDLNKTIEKIKPHYLIMDIEGGEYDIFNIINFQSIKKIQFELHPQILEDEKCKKIFQVLSTNNFTQEMSLSKNNCYYFFKN